MSNSHVSMEQHQCIVCGRMYNTGTLFLHKRLRQTLEPKTLTGIGLCPEHQQLKDDGYIALIECDPSKSSIRNNRSIPSETHRTDIMAHIHAAAFTELFDVPLPQERIAYVEPGVIQRLQESTQEPPE